MTYGVGRQRASGVYQQPFGIAYRQTLRALGAENPFEMDLETVLGVSLSLILLVIFAIGLAYPDIMERYHQINLVASAITSYLVARYLGSRWIYSRQQKREHSLAFVQDIESWAQRIAEYSWIGASYKYGGQGESGIRRSPTGFEVLPGHDPNFKYFVQLKQHLQTGYPNIAKAWERMKQESTSTNQETASVLNTIAEEANTVLRVNGVLLAEHIYDEAVAQKKVDYKVELKAPEVSERTDYEEPGPRFRLIVRRQGDEVLSGYESLEEARSMIPEVHSFITKYARADRLRSLLEREEGLRKEQQLLKEHILEIAKSVQLGGVLKGNCKDCPV